MYIGGMLVSGLYPIVDAEACRARGVGVTEVGCGLAAAGVGLVQWRCKNGSPAEVLAGAALLREAMPGGWLIMNDRVDLAVLAGFHGVHVGQGDLPVEGARSVLARGEHGGHGGFTERRRGRWVGVSTHTEDEVVAAHAGGADYVAIGPVFATATKADAAAVVGLEGVRRARALTTKPLVAIGGITLANCRSVMEAGANSVAVISGLLVEGRSVESMARDFRNALRS